ncbi:MAG: hypothetical protein K1X94_05090 [Sandaracinaceae bacterium]|nr:hypothetical protein [Sandaracinaceae bacterium]
MDILHKKQGNVVATIDRRVLIFVRDRPLTSAALSEVEASLEPLRSTLGPTHQGGVLAVIPGDAGLSSSELLARQRKLFAEARQLGHLWIAFCVTGQGAQTFVLRAAIRMFMPGHPSLSLHDDLRPAVRWLAERTGLSRDVLETGVRELQRTVAEA